MQRSDFTGLPLSIALGIVWDALKRTGGGIDLDNLPVPEKVRPPKYDFRIGRKGGYQWASETDLEGLRFWHTRAAEGAASGGQYAAKDQKRADSLARWIAYREQDPSSPWTGIRDDAQVTAHAPLARPVVHEYESRQQPAPQSYGGEYEQGGEDDIPFINNVSCEAGERWWRR